MARRPVFEACMLCGELPCVCIRAAKKAAPKPRKVKPKSKPVVEEAPVASTPAAPVDDDPPVPRTTAKDALRAAMRAQVKASPTSAPQAVGSDPVTDDAIRALAPILHPDERRNRKAILSQPRTVEVRAAAWRERRGMV